MFAQPKTYQAYRDIAPHFLFLLPSLSPFPPFCSAPPFVPLSLPLPHPSLSSASLHLFCPLTLSVSPPPPTSFYALLLALLCKLCCRHDAFTFVLQGFLESPLEMEWISFTPESVTELEILTKFSLK